MLHRRKPREPDCSHHSIPHVREDARYRAQSTDMAKNDFRAALYDRNRVPHYRLLGDDLKEMLPGRVAIGNAARSVKRATEVTSRPRRP